MLGNLRIPKEVRRKIDDELQPGELIRWVDQPVPQLITASFIVSAFLGIPWTSFAIFWMWGALGFKLPNLQAGLQPEHLFALFGVPFVLIGFGMLSSPLWMWQAVRKTVYLVTDQRAISIEGGWSTTIRSYLPEQLANVYRKERTDGTGDVVIVIRHWKDSDGDQRTEEIGFLGVRNPREVEKILKQLAQNAA
ncbi:hypothetical protein [Pseudanabaena sp. FACHB-2040]|uniref:hypothetical protein n=1 Tax=Pseudanabaena sp. FACHB-2040 TaxID=2692859 RepID=UPI001683DCB7|nr:hypothetical protein [Pseudanabaena sp. FACHB-2040]MBD2258357.1 hypothetical protein [Pseudanabaena sp. FACHB-2040]